MKPLSAFAVAVLVTLAGCTRVTQSSTQIVPSNAVQTTMRQQVRNAVYAGEGDIELRRLQATVVADPNNLDARMKIASRYQASGFPELAVEHYRMARQQKPDSEDLLNRHVEILQSMRMRAEAVGELQKFLAGHVRSLSSHSRLGIILDEDGAHREAEQSHRAAVRLAPANPRLHNNLGYCLLLQERYPEAASEFRIALKLDPWSQTARNNLATCLASDPVAPDTKDAIAHWSATSSPAAAHSNLAAVHIDRGRLKEARAEIGIALTYQRDYAPALRNLQLIAELDGGNAAVELTRSVSRWQRLWAGLKKTIVRTEYSTSGQPPSVAARK